MLLEATAKYLSHLWLQHPEIDWILIDSLIFVELTAYREAVMDGTALGKQNWSYVMSGGNLQKALVFRLVGAIVSVTLRYVLPAVLIWRLIGGGHDGIGVVVAVAWVVYLVSRGVTWLKTRRRIRDAVSLLGKMERAYGHVSPPVVNPSVLRASLDEATTAGARFDGALFSLLERIITRDSATFLPFALR